jgi:hypothetical protein
LQPESGKIDIISSDVSTQRGDLAWAFYRYEGGPRGRFPLFVFSRLCRYPSD